jgi:hypothetical protein
MPVCATQAIDRKAACLFPIAFGIFNIFYWTYISSV